MMRTSKIKYQHISFAMELVNVNRLFDTLRPRQNGRHFADDIFRHIFVNRNVWISIDISLKFIPKGSNWKYNSVSSDNGVAPTRRQAIIWTNDALVYWRIYLSLSLNELMNFLYSCRWNMWVPYLQMSCSELTSRQDTRIVQPALPLLTLLLNHNKTA